MSILSFWTYDIFIYGLDKVIFKCCLLITIGFNEHVYAYEIKLPDMSDVSNECYIFQNKFVCPIPNNMNILSNSQRYVTIRNPL